MNVFLEILVSLSGNKHSSFILKYELLFHVFSFIVIIKLSLAILKTAKDNFDTNPFFRVRIIISW